MQSITTLLKLGHSRVTQAALVEMSRTNLEMMTDNATFPTPIPTLAEFEQGVRRLEKAVDEYRFNPSRLGKLERDVSFRALKALRRELGSYVQAQSRGDQELIASAGFEVERKAQPYGPLPAPEGVRAKALDYPGRISVSCRAVRGKQFYRYMICEGDPKVEANWLLRTTSSKNRVVIYGLESGKTYFFRVVAFGAAGASPVSDSATAKAA